jgi:predicted O-methyltransferase YrrM
VIRRLTARSIVRFAAGPVGRRALAVVAKERPSLLLGPLGWALARDARFSGVRSWPDSVSSFADVAPLVLSSNSANRGVASMSLEEAAHLWRLAEAGHGVIAEIGRERGGSTFLLASAMPASSRLVSFDPQGKLGTDRWDDELREALRRYGLDERVTVSLEDSHLAAVPEGLVLVLVDGDPSYEGTKLDFERFCLALAPGGHALFHDAVGAGPRRAQLAPLLDEIELGSRFDRRPDVGTFAHFVRR